MVRTRSASSHLRSAALALAALSCSFAGCGDSGKSLVPPDGSVPAGDGSTGGMADGFFADFAGSDGAPPPSGDMGQSAADFAIRPLDLSGPFADLTGAACKIQYNGGPPQPSGFRKEFPPGLTQDFRGVWGSSAKDVYYVGLGNTILHTTDGGSTFVPQSNAFPGFVAWFGIWGSSATDIYVVGTTNSVLHSNGNGSFTAQSTPANNILSGVWGSSANDVYVVGSSGVIHHSTGNGTWTQQTSNTTMGLQAIWGSSASDVYAVGLGGVVVHSTGNGAWSVQATLRDSMNQPFTVFSVWGSSASDVYAGGFSPTDGAVLYRSTGNGMWTKQAITSNGGVLAIGGTSASDVYFATAVGEVFHSTGNGMLAMQTTGAGGAGIRSLFVPPEKSPIFLGGSFAYVATGPVNGAWTVKSNVVASGDLHGSTAADATHLYAVAWGGAILASDGSGAWTQQKSGTTQDLWGAWSSSASDIYAVGGTGTILHSTGNGSWTPQNSGSQLTLAHVWGSSAGDVYAVGQAGAILHSTGNGTWTAQASGTASDLFHVWGTGAGNVYAVGGGGGKSVILHSTGNGMWTPQVSPVPNQLLAIGGPAANDLYAVGAGGTVLRSQGDGCWLKVDAGTTYNLWTLTVRGADVFVGGEGGTIVHSTGGPFTTETTGTILGAFTSLTVGNSVFMLGQRQYIQRSPP